MKFTRTTEDGIVRTYDVRFKYKTVIRMGQPCGKTICTISLVNTGMPKGPDRYSQVSSGSVVQDTRDTFEKNEGRKRALTKALRPFDRDARSNAWRAYFAAVNAPHANKKEYAAI